MDSPSTGAGTIPASRGDVEFRILGPVEVFEGGRRARLGGPKQRTVLALVIAAAGRSVSFDKIIEATWGEEPPDGARASVHTYVSNLRSAVGNVIERAGDGYMLSVDGGAIDAVRFESMYHRGFEMLDDAPELAASTLREALSLWRGHPFADVDGWGVFEPDITRLNELRVVTLLARVDADLALGRHSGLIGELESLTLEHPLQEGFRARQMLALYRSGRQAEALRVYDRTRRYLGEELGIDPSPELQRLEQQILEQDSSLDFQVRQTIRHRSLLVADVGDAVILSQLGPHDRAGLLDEVGRAVESSVEGAGGAVFAVRGSAQYASFESVTDAISAAGLTHRALDGSGHLPRIAIDVGDVEIQPHGEFTGPPVARAAALVAAAHSGQTVISSAAHDELVASGTDGWQVRALGSHRLLGFDRDSPIFQLLIEGREQTFPPLQLDAMPPALPGAGRGLFGYELRDLVGVGAFGETYRAYQPSVGREVAIKVIKQRLANHPEFIRRFEVEAQLVARLEHPHIVPLYDYWREPDRAYLVMRLLHGESLATRLEDGPLSPMETARIISQVGGALQTAHRHGVVHRDIKPDNVMLDDAGNAYVTDFGIAQSLISSVELSVIVETHPSPAYVSPEERSGDEVTPATDIFALGVLAHHLLTGRPPSAGSEHSDGSLPIGVESVIRTATSVDPSQRFSDVGEMAAALRRGLGTTSEAESAYTPSRNPYKGLAAFTESDAGDFQGRDDVVDEILGEIAASRLVAVVGPSGIGKSSVVHAGVLPRVRSGAVAGSSRWFITDMVPGIYPFEEFATALLRVATQSVPDLDESLEHDDAGMLRAVQRLLPVDAELLIVIDQFEELFTLADPEARDRFLDALTTLVTDNQSTTRVVVTIRADYFDQPLRHAELGTILRTATVPVGAPTIDELRLIVERPAAAVGVGFEAGVADRIVAEVEGQPGALPLLEYALTDLFEGRASDLITASDLAESGGVLGALGNCAEATFVPLDSGGREAARQMFLRLVSVDESIRSTRLRTGRAELYRLAVSRADLGAALGAFGDVRLLTFDRDNTTRSQTVEVAHEALFSEWARLAGWIEEHREDLLLARRLAAATEDWKSADRTEEYLLSGGRLAQHEAWTASTELTLMKSEQELLTASRLREDNQRRKARRRRLGVVSGFALAAVVAFALAAFAVAARSSAEQAARVTTARGLASASAANLSEDPERSLLLAIAAADTTLRQGEPVLREAVEELYRSLDAHRVLARYTRGGAVTVSPDGSLIAVAGSSDAEPGIEVRDAISGELVSVTARFDELGFDSDISFASDNRTLAMVNSSSEVVLWDAPTGRELARMSNEASGWPRFSPDGSRVLVVNVGGSASLWDWEAGEEVHRLEVVGDAWGADYSPNGDVVAVGERNTGAIVIFDSETGELLRRIEGHPGLLLSGVAFSPDGTRLASSTDIPSQILVSDAVSGDPLLAITSPTESVAALAWSPDGAELALGGFSAELVIIDAAMGEERLRLSGIDGVLHSPAWFPDGTRLAVTGRPAETVVWDVREQNAAGGVIVDAPTSFLSGAWYTEDESVIVLPLYHTGISLFDIEAGAEVGSQLPAGVWVDWPGLPVVSADGRLVAMSTVDGLMTIYDSQTLTALRSFDVGMPISPFSPDGGSIVAAPRVAEDPAPDDIRPGLIDITSGEVILSFDDFRHQEWNGVLALNAAFHPSGNYVAITGPTRVYDTRTGDLVFSPEPWGNGLAFSPDGSRFAIITNTGFVHLYDFDLVITGASQEEAVVNEWQALDATGIVIRWTDDGSMLLAGGMDERLVIFDRNGKETLLRIPAGPVGTIDFSSDGRRLLISGIGGPRILPLDLDELLSRARSRLTRGFTSAECAQFFSDGGCPTFEALRGI